MARVCDICGKGPTTGNYVSHAHNKVRRRWLPNLQRIKVVVGSGAKRIQVCTTCIKSDRVQKSI